MSVIAEEDNIRETGKLRGDELLYMRWLHTRTCSDIEELSSFVAGAL